VDGKRKGWRLKGYVLAGSAGVLWGLISLFGKLLVRYDVDPSAIMAVRATLAFLTLGVALWALQPRALRIGWNDVPFFLLFGLVAVAGSYATYVYALKYTTVTTAVVIGYTYPALVSLLAVFFLDEELRWTKVLALALALGGSFLVAEGFKPGALRVNLTGILFSLGTSVALTLYSLLSKRAVVRYGPWTLSLYGFGFGALWLCLIASPRAVASIQLPAVGWAILVAWAWIPTVLAYGLYLIALKSIEASRATIVCTIEPVSAIALACLFLGETVSGPQLVGAGLVLTGVIVATATPGTSRLATRAASASKSGAGGTHAHMDRREYSNVKG
jgi:drug/metabolite transporter, DME family